MKFFYLTFTVFLFANSLIAQTNPIDFETNSIGFDWNWTVFENSTNPPLLIVNNPSPDATNSSQSVAQFNALQSGNPWAGCESQHNADIGSFSFDENNSAIRIKVWKSVISDVGLKFASNSNQSLTEIKVSNTLVNQWEELIFDFSPYIGLEPLVVDQIIIFPDFDLQGREQDNIIYFDDITFSNVSTLPISGCTDSSAVNFNPEASVDDGSCIACENPALVTFSLDVSEVLTPDLSNVLINGNWDSFGENNEYWGAWGLVLEDEDQDSIYQGTISLQSGNDEYVHALSGEADNYSGWGLIGFAPQGCALGTNPETGHPSPNFFFSVECDQTLELPIQCFGSCQDSCFAYTTPVSYVQFEVDMNNVNQSSDDYTNVVINGSWNNWSGWGVELEDNDNDGIWTGTGEFDANSSFEYVVAVTGPADNYSGWGMQWGEECENNNFNVSTSVEGDTILSIPTVGCPTANEEGCMDPAASNYNPLSTIDVGCLYDVTFSVDMSNFNMAGVETVNVNGDFNGWCGNCNQLYDEDFDGVYSTTIQLPAGPIEYLFTTNGWTGDVEVFESTDECILSTVDGATTFNNRYYEVQPSQNTIPTYCFDSCFDCEDNSIEITFRVDMSNEVVSENGVSVIGSFNGYNINANPMINIGNNVYETTINLNPSNYVFRYANGGLDLSKE